MTVDVSLSWMRVLDSCSYPSDCNCVFVQLTVEVGGCSYHSQSFAVLPSLSLSFYVEPEAPKSLLGALRFLSICPELFATLILGWREGGLFGGLSKNSVCPTPPSPLNRKT